MYILMLILGFAIGLLFSVDSRAGYNEWKKAIDQNRKQIFCQALDNTDVCKRLAEKLEIQADGGDDPADFVKWAVREIWKEADKGVV